MKNKNYEYIIASCPEREKVYCEIYYKGHIICEISQETTDMELEIFAYPNTKEWWKLSLNEFQEAIEIGKQHLLGKKHNNFI